MASLIFSEYQKGNIPGNFNFKKYWNKIVPHLRTRDFHLNLFSNEQLIEIKNKHIDKVYLDPRVSVETWEIYDELRKLDDKEALEHLTNVENLILKKTRFNDLSQIHWWTLDIPEWNKTLGIWLAKTMYPHIDWQVISGKNHTTIYSKKLNYFFDIVAWGWGDSDFGVNKIIHLLGYEEDIFEFEL